MRSWVVLAIPFDGGWPGLYRANGRTFMTWHEAARETQRAIEIATEHGWRYTYRSLNLLGWFQR